jgi:hypothetical protein
LSISSNGGVGLGSSDVGSGIVITIIVIIRAFRVGGPLGGLVLISRIGGRNDPVELEVDGILFVSVGSKLAELLAVLHPVGADEVLCDKKRYQIPTRNTQSAQEKLVLTTCSLFCRVR